MSKIKAVVVDPGAPNRLALADVEEPYPTPSEALVRVAAVSLNRGEVRRVESNEPGFRPGWDLAGTVERAAVDGSGPPEGSRVVGFLPSGAWAELVAVPTDSVAALPEGVSFEEASTLPVAGLTALYALEEGGNLLGNALSMLVPGGTCVSFGASASAEVEFDTRTFYLTGGARLYGFILFHEVRARPASGGLGRLARMVADGRLKPRIEVQAPWTEVGEIARRLIERGYTGKAVLRVGPN